MARGIRNGQSVITSTASSVIDSTIKTASKKLQIHSPSKVFEKFGEYVDLGFVQGLKKLSGDVENTSADLGTNAIFAMSEAIAGISNIVDSNVDTEPTIRPVLDLTSFKSGEKNLNSIVNSWNGLSVSADLAASASKSMFNRNPNRINQNDEISSLKSAIEKLANKQETPNQNITLYITGTDPKAIADEVSRHIQRSVERRDASWA